MKQYKLGLVLGRFQGLHAGHEAVIRRALSVCERVMVFIGSADKAGTVHNPFPVALRQAMLESVFAKEVAEGRILLYPLPDLGVGNVPAWGEYVLENARKCCGMPDCMVYGDEDKCRTWFPNHPEIEFVSLDRADIGINGTKLRALILAGDEETFGRFVDPAVKPYFAEMKAILEKVTAAEQELLPEVHGRLAADPVEQTREYLKSLFAGAAPYILSEADVAYRLEHSFRVAALGRKIAEAEGMDAVRLETACLLHDAAYCRPISSEADWKNHGRNSAILVEPFLENLGFTDREVREMCCGIAIHVDDVGLPEYEKEGRTAFCESVGDADNIDRFDVLRIQEGLEKDGFLKLPLGEKKAYCEKRVKGLGRLRNTELGTKTATAMWKDRIDFQLAFYGKLLDQLNCSEG